MLLFVVRVYCSNWTDLHVSKIFIICSAKMALFYWGFLNFCPVLNFIIYFNNIKGRENLFPVWIIQLVDVVNFPVVTSYGYFLWSFIFSLFVSNNLYPFKGKGVVGARGGAIIFVYFRTEPQRALYYFRMGFPVTKKKLWMI